MDVTLDVPNGVVVETPPLRIPERGEADFRISAHDVGVYDLGVRAGGTRVSKRLCVAQTEEAISPRRSKIWFQRLMHPAEADVPRGPLSSIRVLYPSRRLSLWGLKFHWMWPFFIISVLAGIAVRSVFKVEL